MGRYTVTRLLLAIPVLLLAVTVAFFMLRLIPGDPAELVAGPHASAETVAKIRHSLNLDEPLYVQYGLYLNNLLHGDMGNSNITGHAVADEIAVRLPTTLKLTLGATLLAVILGPLLGLLAALRRNTGTDVAASAASVAGMSIPSFWLGLMLIFLICEKLKWLPSMGGGNLKHYILPSLTLGVASIGTVARMTRTTMLEVLSEDYLRTARSKGLTPLRVLLRHAVPNALIPVVTVLGAQVSIMLGGSLMVETVFSLPGIGRMMVESVLNKDYPMVQGGILVVATLVIIINLIVDLAYGILDPRVRSKG